MALDTQASRTLYFSLSKGSSYQFSLSVNSLFDSDMADQHEMLWVKMALAIAT